MKNAYKMSAGELRALAAQKEAEDSEPIKVGYLKHDLYRYIEGALEVYYGDDDFNSKSLSKEQARLKKQVDKSFELYVKKGTKVTCYSGYGDNCWSDETGEIIDRDDEWAKRNLENIEDV